MDFGRGERAGLDRKSVGRKPPSSEREANLNIKKRITTYFQNEKGEKTQIDDH